MKKFFLGFFLLVFAFQIFALGVNENELKSVDQTIVFENYTGPHAVVNTLEQIKEIGRSLGRTVFQNLQNSVSAGGGQKYYVIHAIDHSTKEKLDADILILGKDAAVDHVRNLRHIIAGYLSAAYGYSERDAFTLATFITVYNAVFRGNLDVFKSKYKEIVTKNLTAQKVGLSVKYLEWPGSSQIVIPVSDVAGGISTIDTSVISEKEVIKSMQEDDDKNIKARKDMVDIKEREADVASEKAAEAQKKADQEKKEAFEAQKEADQAQKRADQAQKRADQAQKRADQAQKRADENPADKDAQKEADDAQKEADNAQKEAESAQKEADEKKDSAEQLQDEARAAKEEASEQQALSDKKANEAQEERREIAQDQKVVEEKTAAEEQGNAVFGLALTSTGNLDSTIVKVNTKDGSVLQKSEVNVIKGRNIYQSGEGFVAVAGANVGSGAIKLVVIDKNSLQIIKESEEILADNSVLLQDGANFLVVIKIESGEEENKKTEFYVAKYDANLKLVTKSPVSVSANSPIVKTSAGYMVTDFSGVPVILNANDLER